MKTMFSGNEVLVYIYKLIFVHFHMDENLAALIGFLISDGSIYFDKSKGTYCIQFTNKSERMLEKFKFLVLQCFGQRNFHLNHCKNASSLRFFSKEIAQYLFSYSPSFRTLRLENGEYPKVQIPREIFASEKLASAFLQAYASSDGCIYSDANHKAVVDIACIHPELKQQLSELLKTLEIKSSVTQKGIRIYRKSEIEKFAFKIRFLPESTVVQSSSANFGKSKNELLDSCLSCH